ncbi:MAG: Na+/H+ antiporter NhaA [Deltaproteobacteria bacterium]|nr:Na+/H+ antiporter NhaA [Deltaproteobacteria bacterium]
MLMPIDRMLRPVKAFARHKLAGAGLLMLATLIALVWANSPWAESYHHTLHVDVKVAVGGMVFSKSVHHLINDGLMGVFFFLVGLEIKREILVGELSSTRKASLPAFAALGGMVIPALLYVAVNPEPPLRSGWGIPMATDIAFALGVLAVLGTRIPLGLKVMLTALAIVDDIGAVLVIAVFYTEQIATASLVVGLLGVGLSIIMSRAGVRNALAYFLVGFVVWLAFLQSGVHATIAALLMAFTIPAKTRIDGKSLVRRLERALSNLERVGAPGDHGLNTDEQQHVLAEVNVVHDAATAPLQNLEHALAPLVTFFVLPLFALANAGVSLEGVGLSALTGGVALGIMVGLVVGKTVGIFSFTWLAVRLGIADLPRGVRWGHVVGIGLLGGVGFTMALFIAGLAFSTQADLDAAKLGILVASAIAGVTGLLVLRSTSADADGSSS